MGTGRSGIPKGLKNTTAKVLGMKMKPLFERHDMIEALRIVNPNYNMPGTGTDYTHNCALCTTAAALQLMGYDVEAMPRDKKWRGFDSVFDYVWTPENFKSPKDKFENYTGIPWDENYHNTNRFTGSDANSVRSEIEAQMKSWGTKSFAAMNVAWKGGGAHVVIVYQEKHQTTVMDFQTHATYSVEQWFNAHPNAKSESIGLYRLDNQKIKSSIKDVNKIVKRRNK